jgi:hypothetical protein
MYHHIYTYYGTSIDVVINPKYVFPKMNTVYCIDHEKQMQLWIFIPKPRLLTPCQALKNDKQITYVLNKYKYMPFDQVLSRNDINKMKSERVHYGSASIFSFVNLIFVFIHVFIQTPQQGVIITTP